MSIEYNILQLQKVLKILMCTPYNAKVSGIQEKRIPDDEEQRNPETTFDQETSSKLKSPQQISKRPVYRHKLNQWIRFVNRLRTIWRQVNTIKKKLLDAKSNKIKSCSTRIRTSVMNIGIRENETFLCTPINTSPSPPPLLYELINLDNLEYYNGQGLIHQKSNYPRYYS